MSRRCALASVGLLGNAREPVVVLARGEDHQAADLKVQRISTVARTEDRSGRRVGGDSAVCSRKRMPRSDEPIAAATGRAGLQLLPSRPRGERNPCMLEAVRNAFRLPDLRQKLLITFGLLALYRLAANIPLPGVNQDALAAMFQQEIQYPAQPAELLQRRWTLADGGDGAGRLSLHHCVHYPAIADSDHPCS